MIEIFVLLLGVAGLALTALLLVREPERRIRGVPSLRGSWIGRSLSCIPGMRMVQRRDRRLHRKRQGCHRWHRRDGILQAWGSAGPRVRAGVRGRDDGG